VGSGSGVGVMEREVVVTAREAVAMERAEGGKEGLEKSEVASAKYSEGRAGESTEWVKEEEDSVGGLRVVEGWEGAAMAEVGLVVEMAEEGRTSQDRAHTWRSNSHALN